MNQFKARTWIKHRKLISCAAKRFTLLSVKTENGVSQAKQHC